jgi:hypothetical protein
LPLEAGNTATDTAIAHSAEKLRRTASTGAKNTHRTRDINLKADQIPVIAHVLPSWTDCSLLSNEIVEKIWVRQEEM